MERFRGNESAQDRKPEQRRSPPGRTSRYTEIGQIPHCGKLVKLFSHGTKVLSHISRHFHPYTLKGFWRFLVLDLVYLTGA
jgi:hypothetical protein